MKWLDYLDYLNEYEFVSLLDCDLYHHNAYVLLSVEQLEKDLFLSTNHLLLYKNHVKNLYGY